jgi:hypothetical protein
MNNFVKYCLERGGCVKPLIIPSELTNGTGLFNPSVFVDGNKIFVNIRHCQYTLYHSELNKYEHQWGPLLYLNPENDITLTTTNYICVLNDDLNISTFHKVDTSIFDKNPLWEFVGLEDCRMIKWDNKYYLSGVRRDVDTIGTGRMELSEIEISENSVIEISRYRIPAPVPNESYCEKNWMPILDKPYHYIKWSNPTEVVKINIDEIFTETIHLKNERTFPYDPRGGSQVIPFKGGYLALTHITHLYRTESDRKNATYRHQFIIWDENFNIVNTSKIFDFMSNKIEFSCGLAKYEQDYLITFGVQDNSSFILKLSETTLEDFIND